MNTYIYTYIHIYIFFYYIYIYIYTHSLSLSHTLSAGAEWRERQHLLIKVCLTQDIFEVVSQKSIPTQICQLILYISNSRRYVDGFVGELTSDGNCTFVSRCLHCPREREGKREEGGERGERERERGREGEREGCIHREREREREREKGEERQRERGREREQVCETEVIPGLKPPSLCTRNNIR